MLNRLKKRLILLYTVMTSVILSVVVSGACYINLLQIKQHEAETFTELRDTIEYKLQTEQIISNSWLSALEVKNNSIIHIEDNGQPYFFQGAWTPDTPRKSLVEKAQNAALAEGVDTKTYTMSSYKYNSSVCHLSGDRKEPVLASVSILPVKNGYMSLTLLQVKSDGFIRQCILIIQYVLIDICGIIALFLVSCFIVKKALKPVEENQRRQNEFIASASHDLRSPLAVIQSNASALLIDGADTQRFAPKIMEECTHMSRLISDMLILASSDAKTWSLQQEPIDTETYLIEFYDSFYAHCQKKNHVLTLELPDDPLPEIQADKGRLTQVLGILLDNAISYSPSQSTVTLRPYQKKSELFIEMEDHGTGIPREQKSYVFNRFYRADKSRNDTTHFGLGLSVAKELMELQNGKILLKDTPGGGATFILILPVR